MTTTNTKHLLFHSQRCEHCRGLLTRIVEQKRRDAFLFVCVDRPGLKIPAFVDRVPMILTSDQRILVDGAIDLYLQSGPFASRPAEQAGGDGATDDGSILPFTLGATLNVDQYAYLTDDGNAYRVDDDQIMDHGRKGMMHQQTWVSVDDNTNIDVAASSSSSASSSSTKTHDDKSYERFMNARKQDDDVIKQILNKQAAAQNLQQPAFVR